MGRLSAELFRSCRLVVDTGLHARGWTVAQAKAYMAAHSAASEGNVDAEVCAVKLGGGRSGRFSDVTPPQLHCCWDC